MRKIRLTQISQANKKSYISVQRKHLIFLGNGACFVFGDIKGAKRFLVNVNRYLNTRLFELNYIYIDILKDYRYFWFYMDQDLLRDYRENNAAIEKNFDLITNEVSTENHNYFVFKHLFYIIGCLRKILIIFRKTSKRRDMSVWVRMMEAYETRLDDLEKDIGDYGYDHSNFIEMRDLVIKFY